MDARQFTAIASAVFAVRPTTRTSTLPGGWIAVKGCGTPATSRNCSSRPAIRWTCRSARPRRRSEPHPPRRRRPAVADHLFKGKPMACSMSSRARNSRSRTLAFPPRGGRNRSTASTLRPGEHRHRPQADRLRCRGHRAARTARFQTAAGQGLQDRLRHPQRRQRRRGTRRGTYWANPATGLVNDVPGEIMLDAWLCGVTSVLGFEVNQHRQLLCAGDSR